MISNDTPYSNSYRTVSLGAPGLGTRFVDTLDEIDDRLPINTLVIGVLAGSEAIAFPLDAGTQSPMQADVGGTPVVVLESGDGTPSLAYHRALSDGRILDFERIDGVV